MFKPWTCLFTRNPLRRSWNHGPGGSRIVPAKAPVAAVWPWTTFERTTVTARMGGGSTTYHVVCGVARSNCRPYRPQMEIKGVN